MILALSNARITRKYDDRNRRLRLLSPRFSISHKEVHSIMKRTVLVFGFISGALIILFMSGTMFFVKDSGFDKGEIVGYSGMVLAFLMVFFGIRSYRENVGGGKISFGRAFAVGLLIMLISSACYVAAWEVIYFKFMHNSMQDRKSTRLNSSHRCISYA